MTIESALVERIRRNISLAGYTTFHLGGPAEYFLEVHSQQECAQALGWAHRQGMPWFLLGGGSNLVVSDAGIDGLVIRNATAEPDRIDRDSARITVSSGRTLEYLLDVACQNGLIGLEALAGIPGSVGGAVYGNAGAYGQCIADTLVEARILFPDGRIEAVGNSFFAFSYRHSSLKIQPGIVTEATFQLRPGDPAEIRRGMDDIIAQRHQKHPPWEIGCAGSFFKNLPPLPGETRRRAAGEVLDRAGVKAMTVGGASVYEKHANFIINRGHATSGDVKALAAMMKASVQQQFSITLEEEVLYIGR